jgi:lipoprotein-anchoring transpeptidase ErfK/SrfK
MKAGARAALILAALALVPAAPAAAQPLASAEAQPAVPKLRPGRFVWFEQPEMVKASTGAEAPIKIVIAIQQQQALIYRGAKLVGVTTVSTGAPGYDTPTGEYKILQKQVFHRSNLYSDAPMPFMQRLTWDGIALHAGELPGHPASHGCIRLPKTFAKQLYDLTALGGTVLVVDDLMDAPDAPDSSPAPLLVADTGSLAAEGAGTASPADPEIAAETENLGGDAFDVVTMRGDLPAEQAASHSSSWVAGPARADAQPR